MVGNKHLLDILLENNFNVVAIFSPEHGFRGNADAGEPVPWGKGEKHFEQKSEIVPEPIRLQAVGAASCGDGVPFA